MGYSPWSHKELDTTEHAYINMYIFIYIYEVSVGSNNNSHDCFSWCIEGLISDVTLKNLLLSQL